MSSYVTKKTPGNTKWFTHDRFGMFIHFGLYSMPARGEWIMSRERIKIEDYKEKYFKHFNPDMFDAKSWAKSAKDAGMKYAVITTKHHEGFCLFDSKYTDYKITNTPFGRDLVKEFVDAFREAGLKIGFYYSLLDWENENFPIDINHPRQWYEDARKLDEGRDMKKYVEYMKNQLTELMTNYGKIDILWADYSYSELPDWAEIRIKNNPWMQFGGLKGKDQWQSEELINHVRSMQPEIIINNRLEIEQDIVTPEQWQPTDWITDKETGEKVVWETCQTFSGSWGYHRDEHTWKSPKMLIDMLVNTVSCGGNLIMNVGPTSRGYFDKRAEDALKVYENWMKYNSRSIYGCTMAEPFFTAPRGTRLTQSEDGKRLYIHLVEYPYANLVVENIADKIEYAQFLHDGSEVIYEGDTDLHTYLSVEMNGENSVKFKLPPYQLDMIDPVIEVFLK